MPRKNKYDIDDYCIELKDTEESLTKQIVIKNQEAEIDTDNNDVDLFLEETNRQSIYQEKIEGLFFRLREHVHHHGLAIFDTATLDSWMEFMKNNLK